MMIQLKIAYNLSLLDCVAFFLNFKEDRNSTFKEDITRNREDTTQNSQNKTSHPPEIRQDTSQKHNNLLRVACLC